MPLLTHAEFKLGDMLVRYQAPAHSPAAPGLVIIPRDRVGDLVTSREHIETHATRHLPAHWQPVPARAADPLLHIQVRGQPYPGAFSQGRSMRGSADSKAFGVTHQARRIHRGAVTIATTLENQCGLTALHELTHRRGESALRVRTTVRNTGTVPLTLELLTSFSLGGLTPFASDDAPGRLWLHRFRSTWSAEGRHEVRSLEELSLERSWVGHGVRAERFGQVGSLPVNGFFPFVGLEDRNAGVMWAAKLAYPGSWQLEAYRKGDQVCLSGGLADHEFGHWSKSLQPGESITSPEAFLTTVSGDIDDACDRLNTVHARSLAGQPAVEKKLPVVFNEWCTSWGNPTHDNLLALADRLRGSGVRYLAIDDGWAERPDGGIQQNGDWRLNRTAFPLGLRATADAIRRRGLIPGIWFEFEVINVGAQAWAETTHQLQRDGVPLQVDSRRFWDFRDPWVHDYLSQRVLAFLRDNNLGYLKVDYNDTVGVGCDGAGSPGEGLRAHLEGVQRFFQRLRDEMPGLVIENCSSGGHRAEPSFVALTAMTSFSDAHETPDIPVIAANLNRMIPARQNQIWAVLRHTDSLQRLSYSLAATFLGRMCLSGEIRELTPSAWQFTRGAIDLYRELAPVIAGGRFRRHGKFGASYQHLHGWQAVIVDRARRDPAFVVWHTFARPPKTLRVPLPPGHRGKVRDALADQPARAREQDGHLIIPTPRAWSGGVIVLP